MFLPILLLIDIWDFIFISFLFSDFQLNIHVCMEDFTVDLEMRQLSVVGEEHT